MRPGSKPVLAYFCCFIQHTRLVQHPSDSPTHVPRAAPQIAPALSEHRTKGQAAWGCFCRDCSSDGGPPNRRGGTHRGRARGCAPGRRGRERGGPGKQEAFAAPPSCPQPDRPSLRSHLLSVAGRSCRSAGPARPRPSSAGSCAMLCGSVWRRSGMQRRRRKSLISLMGGSSSFWRLECSCTGRRRPHAFRHRSCGGASVHFWRGTGWRLCGHWFELFRAAAAAAALPTRPSVCNRAAPRAGSEEAELRRRAERAAALAHLGGLSAAAKALTSLPLAPAHDDMLAALRDPAWRPPSAQVPIDLGLAGTGCQRLSSPKAGSPPTCVGRVNRTYACSLTMNTAGSSQSCKCQGPSRNSPAWLLARSRSNSVPNSSGRAHHSSTHSAPKLGPRHSCGRCTRPRRAMPGLRFSAGVGAYDHISRQGTLSALADRAELAVVLPFAAMFYGSPSTYLYYDAQGTAHEIQGREQRDPLMPCLFAVDQHRALQEARSRMHASDTLYAFLDDIYLTGDPNHTVAQFQVLPEAFARHANIQVRLGKTCAGNSGGEEPPGLLAVLPPQDPEHPCWTGSWTLPAAKQGIVVLGSPVGNRKFVKARLEERRDQAHVLDPIPHGPHLQSAWLLLLFCGAPRCTYDADVRRCLATLLSGERTGRNYRNSVPVGPGFH